MPKTTKTTKGKPKAARPRIDPAAFTAKPPSTPRLLPPEDVSVLPRLPLYEIPPDKKEADWLSVVGSSLFRSAEFVLFEEPYIPFLRGSLQDWQARSVALAQKVCDGDEKALFALVKHDPRYLMSPAVIVKLMCWRLQIHMDRTASPSIGETPGPLPGHRNAAAQVNLRRLAEAVRFTIGRGHHHTIDRTALLSEYEEVQSRVRCVLEAIRTRCGPLGESMISTLADRHRMQPEDIQRLLRSPRSHRAVAMGIVSRRFKLSTEHIRRRIREARAARVIVPDPGE